MPTADEALRLLREGNARFARGDPQRPNTDPGRRNSVVTGQRPFAVVLGCVDSRVPPEVVFDRGLGDLLVVRTAGHSLDGIVMGSVEFGVRIVGIPLVVVLGHEGCGAVATVLEAVEREEPVEGALAAIADAIEPSVRGADGRAAHLDAAIVRHVERVVEDLRANPALADRERRGELQIVGARYALRSGLVELIV